MKKEETTKDIVREIMGRLVKFPDLEGLVSFAWVFGYPLTTQEVFDCLKEREDINPDTFQPKEVAKHWKKLGISRQILLTAIDAMLEYGHSRLVVEIAIEFDCVDIHHHILTSDIVGEAHELSDFLPLVYHEPKCTDLEIFLQKSVESGDYPVAQEVAQQIGRSLKNEELEIMLNRNMDLSMISDVSTILGIIKRPLTKKESTRLIEKCISNDIPCEVALAVHLVGRPLELNELMLLRDRLSP